MTDFVTNFLPSTQNHIFWISATAGTVVFLLRVVLSFFGNSIFEHEIDIPDAHDGLHHDGYLLKLLSIHSLSGFLMMFGWSGLACINQFGHSTTRAFLIALACGFAMLIITTLIMRAAMSLESTGAIFSINKTIGLTGSVCQKIPAHGQGKVTVVVNNITREVLAKSHNKKPIESFSIVKVIKAIDHEIIEVTETEEK